VPHAVIRIAEHERKLLDNHGVAFIRLRFAKIARLCLGHQVVLYQSARNIGAYKLPVGYFAIARVANLLQLPGANSRRCALYLDDFIPLDPARTMVELGRAVEPGLMATAGHFEGWKASEDVRPISHEQFQSFLTERQGVPSPPELDPTAMVPDLPATPARSLLRDLRHKWGVSAVCPQMRSGGCPHRPLCSPSQK
jgi:hypothetical protein